MMQLLITEFAKFLLIFVSVFIASKLLKINIRIGTSIKIAFIGKIGLYVLNFVYFSFLMTILPTLPYMLQLLQALMIVVTIKIVLDVRLSTKYSVMLGVITYVLYYFLNIALTSTIQQNIMNILSTIGI